MVVWLDVCPDDREVKNEGLPNDVINLVQKLHKEAQLTPTDAISGYYVADKLEQVINYDSDQANR